MSNYKLTPLKAIRKKCLDCSGNQLKEIRECHLTQLHIPAHPDGESGGIRTANRKYPDTLSVDLICFSFSVRLSFPAARDGLLLTEGGRLNQKIF